MHRNRLSAFPISRQRSARSLRWYSKQQSSLKFYSHDTYLWYLNCNLHPSRICMIRMNVPFESLEGGWKGHLLIEILFASQTQIGETEADSAILCGWNQRTLFLLTISSCIFCVQLWTSGCPGKRGDPGNPKVGGRSGPCRPERERNQHSRPSWVHYPPSQRMSYILRDTSHPLFKWRYRSTTAGKGH